MPLPTTESRKNRPIRTHGKPRSPEFLVCVAVALMGLVYSQCAFQAGPLNASMPALDVSQPVVATLLGIAVLGERVNTDHAAMLTLGTAAVVMTVAIAKLARDEASAANRSDQRPAVEAGCGVDGLPVVGRRRQLASSDVAGV